MRRSFRLPCLLLLALSVISVTSTADAVPKKIDVLIVTGFDVGSHKWKESTKLVQTILEKTGRFDVSVSEDKEVFASPTLSDYDVVVLNYGFWKEPDPSEKAKTGLLNYAKQGGHGPYGPFTVKIKNAEHPITQGMEDFRTEDELYAKLDGDAEIEVLATAYSDWSKKVEPIVFVKRHGKGRVVHNVLGHGLISKQNASYQQLLSRGVEWAATGKVQSE